MSVDLASLGSEIVGYLKLFEEERDTTDLQKDICQACCEKPIESKETAIGKLHDLTEKLKAANFLPESEPQLLIAKKISELKAGEAVPDEVNLLDLPAPVLEQILSELPVRSYTSLKLCRRMKSVIDVFSLRLTQEMQRVASAWLADLGISFPATLNAGNASQVLQRSCDTLVLISMAVLKDNQPDKTVTELVQNPLLLESFVKRVGDLASSTTLCDLAFAPRRISADMKRFLIKRFLCNANCKQVILKLKVKQDWGSRVAFDPVLKVTDLWSRSRIEPLSIRTDLFRNDLPLCTPPLPAISMPKPMERLKMERVKDKWKESKPLWSKKKAKRMKSKFKHLERKFKKNLDKLG